MPPYHFPHLAVDLGSSITCTWQETSNHEMSLPCYRYIFTQLICLCIVRQVHAEVSAAATCSQGVVINTVVYPS